MRVIEKCNILRLAWEEYGYELKVMTLRRKLNEIKYHVQDYMDEKDEELKQKSLNTYFKLKNNAQGNIEKSKNCISSVAKCRCFNENSFKKIRKLSRLKVPRKKNRGTQTLLTEQEKIGKWRFKFIIKDQSQEQIFECEKHPTKKEFSEKHNIKSKEKQVKPGRHSNLINKLKTKLSTVPKIKPSNDHKPKSSKDHKPKLYKSLESKASIRLKSKSSMSNGPKSSKSVKSKSSKSNRPQSSKNVKSKSSKRVKSKSSINAKSKPSPKVKRKSNKNIKPIQIPRQTFIKKHGKNKKYCKKVFKKACERNDKKKK